MAQPIWNDLNKALDDDTKIEQSIEGFITAHNDDPAGHMNANASVEVHRDSVVADHVEESVLNDKIHTDARSYIAIVGGTDPDNYANIEDAVLFATAQGGGWILVLPGEYQLTTQVYLYSTINIEGTDPEEVIIKGSWSSGKYFWTPAPSTGEAQTQHVKNIRFEQDGHYIFRTSTSAANGVLKQVFDNCEFLGSYNHIRSMSGKTVVRDCYFETSNSYAIYNMDMLRIENTEFVEGAAVSDPFAVGCGTPRGDWHDIIINGCKFLETSGGELSWLSTNSDIRYDVEGSLIQNMSYFTTVAYPQRFYNNDIFMYTTRFFNFTNAVGGDHLETRVRGNIIRSSSITKSIRLGDGTQRCIVTDNILGNFVDNKGTNNVVANNVYL